MSEHQNGKGSKPRPYSVNQETFASNWERVFGKKEKICEYSGLLNVEEYHDASERNQDN